MNTWISLVPIILKNAPHAEKAFGKDWLYQEAKIAHPESTSPLAASPVAAMLLEMAKRNDISALQHADRVFAEAINAGAKRLKELKNDGALVDGTAWQGLSELSLYERLKSDGAHVSYDQTSDKRTPDFIRRISDEEVGIEHVAPGQGDHLKTMGREAEESLARAHRVSVLFDHAKALYLQNNQIPPFTESELLDIALSHGKIVERGKSTPRLTEEELRQAIEMHTIEETRSFSARPYVAARANSRADEVRHLRQLKSGGEQVANVKWKILAISLPDALFRWDDLKETIRFEDHHDHDLAHIWSGVVWHAIYGTVGKVIYCGEYEHLIKKGIRRLSEVCDGDGLLVAAEEPWHAVVVSLFSSNFHKLKSPGSTRIGGDILPLKLSASRALFLRANGPTLPDKIVTELSSLLSIKEIIKP